MTGSLIVAGGASGAFVDLAAATAVSAWCLREGAPALAEASWTTGARRGGAVRATAGFGAAASAGAIGAIGAIGVATVSGGTVPFDRTPRYPIAATDARTQAAMTPRDRCGDMRLAATRGISGQSLALVSLASGCRGGAEKAGACGTCAAGAGGGASNAASAIGGDRGG